MLFFFFLVINLLFFIPADIAQILNSIIELVIPIEIPTKEAKAEMETQLVILEITTSKWSI